MMQQSLRWNRGDYYIIHEILPPAGISLTLSTSDSISSESLAIFMLLQGPGIKSPVEAEFSGLRPTTPQAPYLHFPHYLPMGRSCTYHYMSLLVAWQRCHCHQQHQAHNLLAQWHPAHYSITSSIWDNRKPGHHCSITHGRGTKRASPVDEELLLSTSLSPSKRTWGGDVTDVVMREKAPAVIQKE